MKKKFAFAFFSIFVFTVTCFAKPKAVDGVDFGNLKDGQHVTSPFKVVMKVSGKALVPAGDPTPNSGHHHLIINDGPVEEGQVIPADSTHLHFGKAQTETELKLDKGKYKLTLQFADMNHLSFGKNWSRTITVVVD
jgi:hypothetical protein